VIEKLPQKRQLIYQIIAEHKGITAQQISEKYLIPINEVVGRISELKERCLVEEYGSVDNNYSGHKNTVYRAIKNRSEIIDRVNIKYAAITTIKDALTRDLIRDLSPYSKELLSKQLYREDKRIKVLEQTLELITE